MRPIPIELRDDFLVTMYELDEETCRHLAGRSRFGRVGVDDGDGPVVLPVNALVAHDRVLFRTAPGSPLDRAAERRSYVAYEIDEVDPGTESGWSVVIRGHAGRLTDEAILASIADTDVRPWAPAGRDQWIEIPVEQITGRIIRSQRLAWDRSREPYMPPG